MGQIEIQGVLPKGTAVQSKATSMVEQKDNSDALSAETNEGVLIISLPPRAVPMKFIANDDMMIVWPYPNVPQPFLGALSVCVFNLDQSLEA